MEPHKFNLQGYNEATGDWLQTGVDYSWGYTNEFQTYYRDASSGGNINFKGMCQEISPSGYNESFYSKRWRCIKKYENDFSKSLQYGIRISGTTYYGWDSSLEPEDLDNPPIGNRGLWWKWKRGLDSIWNSYSANEKEAASCLWIRYMNRFPPYFYARKCPKTESGRPTFRIRFPYFNGQPPGQKLIWQSKINDQCKSEKIKKCVDCCKTRGLDSNRNPKFPNPNDWCDNGNPSSGGCNTGSPSVGVRSFGVSAFIGESEVNRTEEILKNSIISYYPYNELSTNTLYNPEVSDNIEINVNEIRKLAVANTATSFNDNNSSGGGGAGNTTDTELVTKCITSCTNQFNAALNGSSGTLTGTVLTEPRSALDVDGLYVWGDIPGYAEWIRDGGVLVQAAKISLKTHMDIFTGLYARTYNAALQYWDSVVRACVPGMSGSSPFSPGGEYMDPGWKLDRSGAWIKPIKRPGSQNQTSEPGS